MCRPSGLTEDQWALVLEKEFERREERRGFFRMFPDEGPLRRDLYQRHIEFMRLGATRATRCFMAANRVGKTKTGSYDVACHATGLYPDWWEGRRFDRATEIWVAGDTKETVRDIIQRELVGAQGQEGTGMIPGDELQKVAYRPNGNGAVDYALVKHVSGGTSRIGFKSYDQKRESFQGTAKDLIWLDEESDEGIRAECVMRLMTTNGLLMETFTPLKGLTPIVLTYLGDSQPGETRTALTDDRAMIMAGWDDVPQTRPGAYTSQVELSGDVKEAERYVPLVTQQMAAMHMINTNNFEIADRFVDLGGGSSILCRRKFTEDVARIHVPPKPAKLAHFWMNFDAGKQKDFSNNFVDSNYKFNLRYTDPERSPGLFNVGGHDAVGFQTAIPRESFSGSGMLYHKPLQDTEKTFSTVVVATLGGIYPDSDGGSGGGGFNHYYQTPYGDTGVSGSIDSGWSDDDGSGTHSIWRIYFSDTYSDVSYSGTTKETSLKFVICQESQFIGMSRGVENEANYLSRVYVNGNLVNEGTYRTYFNPQWVNDDASICQGFWSYGVGHSGIHHAINLNRAFLNDEVTELTDKLAGKWGV